MIAINRLLSRAVAIVATVTLLALLALGACASAPDATLNSERIQQTFGSYGVEVLSSSDTDRVSSLYSDTELGPVTRTFAVVEFARAPNVAYLDEHRRIVSGHSIGATFKSAGWEIDKRHVFIGEFDVPQRFDLLARLMQIGLPATLAAHVYRFNISKDGRSFDYATIVEVHHPDYLDTAELKSLYGEILFDDSGRDRIDDFIDPALLSR